jgi:hypothetical protein
MVLPAQVTLTKTALNSPTQIDGGGSAAVIDNIRPGMLEAFRGNRAAQNSRLVPTVSYPLITGNQILISFDKRVRFYGITSVNQLYNMLEITTETNPNSPLTSNMFSVAAYNDNLTDSMFINVNDVRMIVITLHNVNEAVNVKVRATYLWNGLNFFDTQFVLNNEFSTGYMGVTP